MAVLLDTDHFSILQREERPAMANFKSRLDGLPANATKVSIVSFQEQAQGWLAYIHRARKPGDIVKGFFHLQGLLTDYANVEVLPFDQQAMAEFLNLRRLRIHIGTSDLRIAAIARVNGVKLLSRNLRDFRQVPGLDVEDWTV